MLKKITALAVVLALAPTFASAIEYGESSDKSIIRVGPTEHIGEFHSATGPAVGLVNIKDGATVAVSTLLMHGLYGHYDEATDVTRFGRVFNSDQPDSHSAMGQWTIGEVGGANLYFGVWEGVAASTGQEETVAFYVGENPTTSLAAVTGKTIKYDVIAVQSGEKHELENSLKAELIASIKNDGTGSLTGKFMDGSNELVDEFRNVTIKGKKLGVRIHKDATFRGITAAKAGSVTGQFYGNNAEAIVGFVDYTNSAENAPEGVNLGVESIENIAFGGTGVIQNP